MQLKVKETKQSCMKEWTLSTSAKATADGRKRKAEVLAEGSKNKFVFNKRGKLKDDEIKELGRTNKNIFCWLKPTPPPMITLAEVVELECQEEVQKMDMFDTVWEERLERVRLRQLEWACKMLCKGLVMEMATSRWMSWRGWSTVIG